MNTNKSFEEEKRGEESAHTHTQKKKKKKKKKKTECNNDS